MPRFMLEGIATPEVYASLIKTPVDRGDNARGLIEKAGGKLVDYYAGIHNYKNYVVVDFPDHESLAKLLTVLYASGSITEATATEIVTSDELADIFRRAGKLTDAYGVPE